MPAFVVPNQPDVTDDHVISAPSSRQVTATPGDFQDAWGTGAAEELLPSSRTASEIILGVDEKAATTVFPPARRETTVLFGAADGDAAAPDAADEPQQPAALNPHNFDDAASFGLSGQVTPAWNGAVSVASSIASMPDSPTHVTRCYVHDPYNFCEPLLVTYACTCDGCNSGTSAPMSYTASTGTMLPESMGFPQESFESRTSAHCQQQQELQQQQQPQAFAHPAELYDVYPEDAFFAEEIGAYSGRSNHGPRHDMQQQPQQQDAVHPTPLDDFCDGPSSTLAPSMMPRPRSAVAGLPHPQQSTGGDITTRHYHTVPEALQNSRDRASMMTPFMPPPPPPRVMRTIFHDEGVPRADAVCSCTLFRWFARAVLVQDFWVAENDRCPEFPTAERPQPYTLEQWTDMAGCWWFAHFEHLQKRQRPYYYTRY